MNEDALPEELAEEAPYRQTGYGQQSGMSFVAEDGGIAGAGNFWKLFMLLNGLSGTRCCSGVSEVDLPAPC